MKNKLFRIVTVSVLLILRWSTDLKKRSLVGIFSMLVCFPEVIQ